MDEIIIFERLSDSDLTQIVEIQTARLVRRIAPQKITLALSDAAKFHLAQEVYDPVCGARPLKRAIQRSVLDPLSLEILAGRFCEGDVIIADAVEGKIAFVK